MPALRIVNGMWLMVCSNRKTLCLFFVSILFTIFYILFTASPALAEKFTPLTSDNFNDTLNVERFYRNQLVTLHVMFFGTDPLGAGAYSEKVVMVNEGGKTKLTSIPGISTGSVNNGVLSMLGTTVTALYTPPTSSVEYLADLGRSVGLTPKVANAQVTGSGSGAISPVFKLWEVMRNIAYMCFILIFIAAGVMIMFRQKLNPQTVIGIQQALPGLVIGLILVTFSYFVAALMVDLAFVGTRVVAEIFIATKMDNYYMDDNGSGGRDFNYTYTQSNALDMYGRAATRVNNVTDVFGAVWGVINSKNVPFDPARQITWDNVIKSSLTTAAVGAGIGIIVPGVGNVVGAVVGGVVGLIAGLGASLAGFNLGQAVSGGVVSLLAGILVPIILAIALMIQFIRLIIALLMSYLQILVMVIFGPFLILFSAIPGRGEALTMWWKSLLANALVFPAVFAGFLFAGMILNFNDPMSSTMPLFGGMGTDIIKVLLAFGILLALPSIPDQVRNALGVKAPQGFTQAAIGGFMGGVAVGRVGLQQGYRKAMQHSGLAAERRGIEEAKMTQARDAFMPIAAGTASEVRPRGIWGRIKRALRDHGPDV